MERIENKLAWQKALELSANITTLCESFSEGDKNILVQSMKQAVVAVPSQIASDLLSESKPSLEPVGRLAAQIALVHKLYPAIDTGDIPEKLDALIAQLSDNFTEELPAPAPEPSVEEEPAVEAEAGSADATEVAPEPPVVPEATVAAPEPPATPKLPTAPAPSAIPVTQIDVRPAQEA